MVLFYPEYLLDELELFVVSLKSLKILEFSILRPSGREIRKYERD